MMLQKTNHLGHRHIEPFALDATMVVLTVKVLFQFERMCGIDWEAIMNLKGFRITSLELLQTHLGIAGISDLLATTSGSDCVQKYHDGI